MVAAGVLGTTVLYMCLERFSELLITYAMYWHPFVLITPGLCVGLAWIFSCLPGAVCKPFALLGKASFEIFLFNVWIEVLGKKYAWASSSLEWLLWSAASIAAGCAYHWLIGRIFKQRS